jgi:multidrug efflux pump subunit AcrA (membrane-fusion protein)
MALAGLSPVPANGSEAAVTRGRFHKSLILNGKLNAVRAEQIYVPRSNSWQIPLKWMVAEGTAVKPGEVVVRFDNSGQGDQLENLANQLVSKNQEMITKQTEMENTLQEKRLQLRSKEIDYEKARLDAEVPEHLQEARTYQENQLALTRAKKDWELARTDLETTEANFQAEIDILKVEIEKLDQDYQRRKAMLDALEIEARSEGIAIHAEHPWEGRKLQIGETVHANWVVMTIPDLDSLEVEAFATEMDANRLALDQTVVLHLDAFPDKSFNGRIVAVDNKGQEREIWGKSSWFRVRIAIDDVDPGIMRPGMSVRAEVNLIDVADALLVPLSCVRLQADGYWVQPRGGEAVRVEPIGFNAFHLALKPDGGLREQTPLEPIAHQEGP